MKLKVNKKKIGCGFLNSAINNLPFEMHMPGYQFCGPGTKLKKRLDAGQRGINGLDRACRNHDMAYDNSKNFEDRKKADGILSKQAMDRAKSGSSNMGEKLAALTVASLMKAKSAIGAGVSTRNKVVEKLKIMRKQKKKKKADKEKKGKKAKKNFKKNSSTNVTQFLRSAVNSAKIALTQENPKTMSDAVRVAIQAAKSSMGKNQTTSKPNNIHRVIPVPKIGGVLPLIPIFAGLSALGALTGGSAAVANAVITANNAKQRLKESERHNQMMEAIALGKNRRGDGVFLKPYRNGLGLYTHKRSMTKNF